jgi:hypothetical protein
MTAIEQLLFELPACALYPRLCAGVRNAEPFCDFALR